MKHRPDSATHCAPWTKHSISSPPSLAIRRTSSSVHSRASTTRDAPCPARKATASEFEVDICVETWNATPCFLQSAITPQSETIAASTYGFAASRTRATSAVSPSNMIALSARYAFAPRARQRRAISGRSSSRKFTPLRARMLKVPSPK